MTDLPPQVVIFDQYRDGYGEMAKMEGRVSECRRWAEDNGVRVRQLCVEWVRDGAGTTWENLYPYHLLCALLICHTLPADLLIYWPIVIGEVGYPPSRNQLEVFRHLRSDLGVRQLWTIAGRVEFGADGLPQVAVRQSSGSPE